MPAIWLSGPYKWTVYIDLAVLQRNSHHRHRRNHLDSLKAIALARLQTHHIPEHSTGNDQGQMRYHDPTWPRDLALWTVVWVYVDWERFSVWSLWYFDWSLDFDSMLPPTRFKYRCIWFIYCEHCCYWSKYGYALDEQWFHLTVWELSYVTLSRSNGVLIWSWFRNIDAF